METDRIARPATARYAAGLRPGEQTFATDAWHEVMNGWVVFAGHPPSSYAPSGGSSA